jgi:hypothetical protein
MSKINKMQNGLWWYLLRTIRGKVYKLRSHSGPADWADPDVNFNTLLRTAIESGKPKMIARFGITEVSCLISYQDLYLRPKHWYDFLRFILVQSCAYKNFDPKVMYEMQVLSGFFPSNTETLCQFARLILEDTVPLIDVLITLCPVFEQNLAEHLKGKIICNGHFSFDDSDYWGKALKGRRVLVIHPFEATIREQYAKREKLFKHPDTLPEFELLTLKAVQGLADSKMDFDNWFEALAWMKSEIDRMDFDVAIIGAGAYGMPLAAHVKKKGKVAIHLGGLTQLLFGIKGARWDNSGYYNEHWIRPLACDHLPGLQKVENGCYW